MSTRNPTKTREELLEAAFWEMYEVGFQSASLDRIIKKTGVTKGALYHHFGSKTDLGYAVIDEVIAGWIRERWIEPLAGGGDPLTRIATTIEQNLQWAVETGLVAKGCPLNNLAQEMSALDEGFRSRVERVFTRWRDGYADLIRRGQAAGSVRTDVDADEIGLFIVGTLEGMTGLIKSSSAPSTAYVRPLFLFLESLRAEAKAA